MSDKKKVEIMLKENAEALMDDEKILFRPKFEEVAAKSLTWKNKSRKLFNNLKNIIRKQEGWPKEQKERNTLTSFATGHRKEAKALYHTPNLSIPELLFPEGFKGYTY